MNSRDRLPSRRPCVTRDFVHHGQLYFLSAGCFPNSRRIAEIFLSSRRPGSEAESIARDGAILVSLCLQHGVDISTIAHALTRDHDGSAATAIGVAVDLLAVVDLAEPTP